MNDNVSTPALDPLACTGSIADGMNVSMVTFELSVGQSGHMMFTMPRTAASAENFWLMRSAGAGGRLAVPLSVEGATSDGRRFQSDRLYVTEISHELSGAKGGSIELVGRLDRAALIAAGPPDIEIGSAAGHVLQYRTIGMRGLRQAPVSTPCGSLLVVAPTVLAHADHLSGAITIEHDPAFGGSCSEWLSACDDLVERVLEVLSLAEGRRLCWCIRELFKGDCLIRSDFRRPQTYSLDSEPLWHDLDLQPFIELAVRGYSASLRESRGVGLAIAWLFAHSPYAEIKLAAAQSTLEHLVACYDRATNSPASALSKEVFDEHVRPPMEAAVRIAAESLSGVVAPDAAAIATDLFRGKLGTLNSLTLRERLIRMLRNDGVPYAGLETAIFQAISARGGIVHGGRRGASSGDLARHVAVLRELIKRILLTLLGHRGRYVSYLNGPIDVDLPTLSHTAVES